MQYIESVNKRGREDSRRHNFYPGSPSTLGYVQSLTLCKDFTKNKWSADQVLQTLQPAATYCFSAVIPAEPTADQETTQNPLCVSRNTLAEPYSKSLLYRIHYITNTSLTLLPAVGSTPVQTLCTQNYNPVIQEQHPF